MKKKNGWKWMLGLTIWFAIGTLGCLTSNMYDAFSRWPVSAGLMVVFAGLTIWMRSNAKRAEAEELQRKLEEKQRKQEDEQRKLEEEKRRKAEREAAIQKARDRFRFERFAVAGVTFKNENGTDRQKILREIALNEDGECAVWFDENEDLGEASGISVITESGQVGNIRRSDKKKIRRFFDHKVNTIRLSVDRFESDDGEKIYRADVVIGMDKTDPEQQWYFDDLPESEV